MKSKYILKKKTYKGGVATTVGKALVSFAEDSNFFHDVIITVSEDSWMYELFRNNRKLYGKCLLLLFERFL